MSGDFYIQEESFDIEYKKSIKGLDSEDIVAFANSEKGGVIYIGVEDTKDKEGKQVGRIIGTPINDDNKLSILNKAQSCVPPVEVDILVEEYRNLSVYKIKIIPGKYGPYCTKSGTYKTRGDGQNQPITPNQLLTLFMENERNKFFDRFKESTFELESLLQNLNKELIFETKKIVQNLQSLEVELKDEMNAISSTADNVDMNADSIESSVADIESTADDIWYMLISALYQIPIINAKLNDLMRKHQVNNTYEDQKVELLKESIGKLSPKTHERYINNKISALHRIFPSITKDEIKALVIEILKENGVTR